MKTIQIMLENRSGMDICNLYISVAGANQWTRDFLSEETVIEENGKLPIVYDCEEHLNVWDWKIEDCDGNQIVIPNINLQGSRLLDVLVLNSDGTCYVETNANSISWPYNENCRTVIDESGNMVGVYYLSSIAGPKMSMTKWGRIHNMVSVNDEDIFINGKPKRFSRVNHVRLEDVTDISVMRLPPSSHIIGCSIYGIIAFFAVILETLDFYWLFLVLLPLIVTHQKIVIEQKAGSKVILYSVDDEVMEKMIYDIKARRKRLLKKRENEIT